MNRFPFSLATLLTLLPFCAQATQQIYSQNPGGSNTVALGYPVPTPIDSLTPVAGFRRYSSLHARHQQLDTDSLNVSAVQLGSSHGNRPIWAYVLSDDDDESSEGVLPEAGMLQNGGIHAREWQTPEVLTGIFETLIENETDQGLHQYLLENNRIVLIPVLNVDGFLQTQRYPDRYVLSTFSGDPAGWPRDGRMRRKNMRSVDEDLATEADFLFGVDLNRNNAPWWASSNRSSGNVRSLLHHGSGPASEPETLALQQAANLFGSNQLRLYIDTHSFSKLYFMARNGNPRRDQLAIALGQLMAAATGNNYPVSPDPINSGIGTTDEYFAYTYNIPAFTLETEPRDSSAEYGGFGVTHDGFILPENQIERVRTELTRASLIGFYRQSGAPALIAATVREVGTDALQAQLQWLANSPTTRSRIQQQNAGWLAGENYRLTLDFNKPMRQRDDSGSIVNYRGQSVTLSPTVRLLGQHRDGSLISETLVTSINGWCQPPACRRYDSDRYQVEFVWPASLPPADLVNLRVEVTVSDMSGAPLDANPATVLRWQDGSWQNYEDELDVAGDSGGSDQQFYLIRSGEPPIYHGGIVVPALRVGQAFDYQFASDAFTDPEGGALSYSLQSDPGPLPSWLQFDPANRQLSGTPTTAGTVSAQLIATDADGNRTIAPITLTVDNASRSGGGGGSSGFWLTLLLLAMAGWRRR